MIKLDINTNGAWRTVIQDLGPVDQAAVRAACIVITNASVRAGGGRRAGAAWRMRDAEDSVFARCQHSEAGAEGERTVTTAWSFKL